jgi:flagellar hook assembly protein FlgD
VDPIFVNPGADDYRLNAGSPCEQTAADGYNMGAYLGVQGEIPNPDTLMVNVLKPNKPNPFRNNTLIAYQIFTRQPSEHVTMIVYNVRGQVVRTLVDEDKTNGQYFVFWNGFNDDDYAVPCGNYFCRLQVGSAYKKTIKMLWLKPQL